MLRRSLVLLVLGLLGLAAAPSALAVRVHVRVEGKTTTIFGATEPALSATATALDALDAASARGEFYYHLAQNSFGRYVDQIGRYPASGSSGWVFKINGVSAPVGAESVRLRNGDRVLWYWATFGTAGGPETLVLRRTARNCYLVLAQNDRGTVRRARNAMLQVGGRRVRVPNGRACIGRHRGLVRATAPNAVRSNALP